MKIFFFHSNSTRDRFSFQLIFYLTYPFGLSCSISIQFFSYFLLFSFNLPPSLYLSLLFYLLQIFNICKKKFILKYGIWNIIKISTKFKIFGINLNISKNKKIKRLLKKTTKTQILNLKISTKRKKRKRKKNIEMEKLFLQILPKKNSSKKKILKRKKKTKNMSHSPNYC